MESRCPNCGRCPTCGNVPTISPYQWPWRWVGPYYVPSTPNTWQNPYPTSSVRYG